MEAVVGGPPCQAWDGLAAAPQLLLIGASTAAAHAMRTTTIQWNLRLGEEWF
jgi:hypothetical protein